MRKLIKDIEILSASLPGRFSFQFEYAKEKLYSDSENYPCAQQKIMIPVDLQQKDFPTFMISSENFLSISNLDDFWKSEVIAFDDKETVR